jgi:pilus assembly protein CpaE
MPTVIIGHDMPAELAADVSSALQEMGVVVKANGSTPQARQTKVIVVISPKGGSGKTAVSSNLAVALAQRHPGRVVAVDLDVQFGDLGTALSLTPEHTLAQLARTSQIDATTVKLFLTPFANGLFVLAGANDPVDADSISPTHVLSLRCCPSWHTTSTTSWSTRRRGSTSARSPPSSAPPICCSCPAST